MSTRHVIHHQGSPRHDSSGDSGCMPIFIGIIILGVIGLVLKHWMAILILIVSLCLIALAIRFAWGQTGYYIQLQWAAFRCRSKLRNLRRAERDYEKVKKKRGVLKESDYEFSINSARENIRSAESQYSDASRPFLEIIRNRIEKIEKKRSKILSKVHKVEDVILSEKIQRIDEQLAEANSWSEKINDKKI